MPRRCGIAFFALLFMFVPAGLVRGDKNAKVSFDGVLLGVHKSGEYREIQADGSGAGRTLERYAFDSHDDYDFVVQVEKTIFVGRIKIPLAAKSGASRLMRDWPAGTPVQVRLKKKGILKKRMEMKLANPNGKRIPLMLVSVKGPDGREQCKGTRDEPDCTNVNMGP